MKPKGLVAAARITSHTSMSILLHMSAISFTRPMFTLRNVFSSSFTVSATRALDTGTTVASNWYGDVSGPRCGDTACANRLGDSVSVNIASTPWSSTPIAVAPTIPAPGPAPLFAAAAAAPPVALTTTQFVPADAWDLRSDPNTGPVAEPVRDASYDAAAERAAERTAREQRIQGRRAERERLFAAGRAARQTAPAAGRQP